MASGQFERAEVLLRQALTQSPRDVQTWLRHAEVLKRLSRNPDAVASYRLAARILDEEGHHPRAVAALKLALSLVPDDVDLIADIIRSEMRARREGNDVRALFPLSSPSQLLTAASTESGLFQSSSSMSDVDEPQLSLPMSTPAVPPSAHEVRAENAAGRGDAWVPEPTAPNAEAGAFAAPPSPLPAPEDEVEPTLISEVPEPRPSAPIPLVSEVAPRASSPRASAPGASMAGDSSPRPSAPNPLVSEVALSPRASGDSFPGPSAPIPLVSEVAPSPRASAPGPSTAGDSSPRTSAPVPLVAPRPSSPLASGPVAPTAGDSFPRPSAPIPLVSEVAKPSSELPVASGAGESARSSSPLPPALQSTLGSPSSLVSTAAELPPPPPSSPVHLEIEAAAQWPQVRRLSETRIAVQAAEGARWIVLESSSAIAVRFADELEVPDDAEWLE